MMFEKLRERFEREANCILLHGSSSTYHPDRVDVPGGWGATGAPNDAFHQWFHYLRRGFMRACSGMSASLKFRRALQDLDLAVDGNTRISMLGFLKQQCWMRYNMVLYSLVLLMETIIQPTDRVGNLVYCMYSTLTVSLCTVNMVGNIVGEYGTVFMRYAIKNLMFS